MAGESSTGLRDINRTYSSHTRLQLLYKRQHSAAVLREVTVITWPGDRALWAAHLKLLNHMYILGMIETAMAAGVIHSTVTMTHKSGTAH